MNGFGDGTGSDRPFVERRSFSRRINDVLRLAGENFAVRPGRPWPLGVSDAPRGLNFALFSKNSTAATLVLYVRDSPESVLELPLDPQYYRMGHVWHIEIEGLGATFEYGWRLDRKPVARDRVHRFDPSVVVLDPRAHAVRRNGRDGWRSLFVRDAVTTEFVAPPRIPPQDRIIYELHVRGFTMHPSSGVAHPGTFRGLVEKIPYLLDLGVTTVELLPVFEFDEERVGGAIDPDLAGGLRNFWGYDPVSFFALNSQYAASAEGDDLVEEFRAMVREFHRAGLEVFLDVVFNHTGEGDGSRDHTRSFRGIDNEVYYLLDPVTGAYLDYSRCGNTMNCNHPVVREMIHDSLRYWAGQMQVDGFRFDLASIMTRGRDGAVLVNPPLIEGIAEDPVLAETTLIAEAWDAAGLYQVGQFPAFGRWLEWNGPFRDDVRRFVRGEPGIAGHLASRLAGSSDLYGRPGGSPLHSVNFVTCHDGFTLRDLVSYDRKHNEANGEGNRDGSNDNLSWNCGVEGPTDDPRILALRLRQTINCLTILLLSQGVPMLLAGDEIGRTQNGNNNAWCHDNETGWIDWSLLESNGDLYELTRRMIAFRKAHSVLRRTSFFTGRSDRPTDRPDVTWHGARVGQPDWGPDAHVLAMHLAGEHAPEPDCDLYFAANNGDRPADLEVPAPPKGCVWVFVVDTSEPIEHAFAPEGNESPVHGPVRLESRSVLLLRSMPT